MKMTDALTLFRPIQASKAKQSKPSSMNPESEALMKDNIMP
jgi:hypothetical protein